MIFKYGFDEYSQFI